MRVDCWRKDGIRKFRSRRNRSRRGCWLGRWQLAKFKRFLKMRWLSYGGNVDRLLYPENPLLSLLRKP